jgi:hypothetical protein
MILDSEQQPIEHVHERSFPPTSNQRTPRPLTPKEQKYTVQLQKGSGSGLLTAAQKRSCHKSLVLPTVIDGYHDRSSSERGDLAKARCHRDRRRKCHLVQNGFGSEMLHLYEEMYSPRKFRGAVPPTIADSGHEDALSDHEHPLARPLPTSPRRIHLERRDALRRPRMRGSRRPWPKQRTTSVAPPYHQRHRRHHSIVAHNASHEQFIVSKHFRPRDQQQAFDCGELYRAACYTSTSQSKRAHPVEQMAIPTFASDGQLRYTHVCGSRIQERE